jgi:hypothetical protein
MQPSKTYAPFGCRIVLDGYQVIMRLDMSGFRTACVLAPYLLHCAVLSNALCLILCLDSGQLVYQPYTCRIVLYQVTHLAMPGFRTA